MTKVAKSFQVDQCHVDISGHWPYVKYNLNHSNEKYCKRGRICELEKNEDILHIVQQIFNFLTSKTMVSCEWSIENLCSPF